jgi:hypothetical protein
MKGFISYSHQDTGEYQVLRKHLGSVQRAYGIEFWADTRIHAGHNWDATIRRAISEADVFLLVVSESYIDSDYINRDELPAIINRLRAANILAIPTILRRCGWQDFFGQLQAVPTDSGHLKPIADWQPEHDGYDRAREQIAAAIKERFQVSPTRLDWPDHFQTLTQDEGGLQWVRRDEQFIADQAGNESDQAVASRPLVQQQHADVARKATEFMQRAGRLDNLVGWTGIEGEAKRLLTALECPTERIPGRLGAVYGAILTLASFLEMDFQAHQDRGQPTSPLDIDVHRSLSDLIEAAGIWIRQFPTARTFDDALWEFSARQNHNTLANIIIGIARQRNVVSAPDAAHVSALLQAGERGNRQGTKAAGRAILGIRNLLYRSGSFVSRFALGTVVASTSSDLQLRRRVQEFLTVAEPEITEFATDLPADVRHSLAKLFAAGKQPRPFSAPDCGLDPSPSPTSSPEPLGFSLVEVMRLILSGTTPPSEWIPFITELDFSGGRTGDGTRAKGGSILVGSDTEGKGLAVSELTDLRPLSGLVNLRLLNVSFTRVGDLSPLASLIGLQQLLVRGCPITDVRPLASLTNLRYLDINRTKVSDLAPLVALTNLETLEMGVTPVTDLSPIKLLRKLQRVDLFGVPAANRSARASVPDVTAQDANGQPLGNQQSTPTRLPANGTPVPAILLAEKTKRGGWKAHHGDYVGAIFDSDKMPPDAKPGDEFVLYVHNSTMFRFENKPFATSVGGGGVAQSAPDE